MKQTDVDGFAVEGRTRLASNTRRSIEIGEQFQVDERETNSSAAFFPRTTSGLDSSTAVPSFPSAARRRIAAPSVSYLRANDFRVAVYRRWYRIGGRMVPNLQSQKKTRRTLFQIEPSSFRRTKTSLRL